MAMMNVQATMCRSCIYRPDSPLDLAKLEGEIADRFGGFTGWRVCHHSAPNDPVCCAGFWQRHKDQFQLGQVAQRLNMVRFVTVDALKGPSR
jgi:hypothetical protein